MIVLVDNYDSFTFNLVHYFGELGADVVVHRNDALSADHVIALKPEAIVLSPGPCDPDKAGICLDMIHACAGHQDLGRMGGLAKRMPITAGVRTGRNQAARSGSAPSVSFEKIPRPWNSGCVAVSTARTAERRRPT